MAEAKEVSYTVIRGIGLKKGKAVPGDTISSKDAVKEHVAAWLKSGAIEEIKE